MIDPAAGVRTDAGPATEARDALVARGPSRVPDTHSENLECIPTIVVEDHDDIARLVASRIAEIVRARAAEGRPAVLGLATGSTPIGV
jgi:glucosamine-6-phosphate deaminase